MYGTGIGLPAAGALGGGFVFSAIHFGSWALAVFALAMIAALVVVLARNIGRRAPNRRP